MGTHGSKRRFLEALRQDQQAEVRNVVLVIVLGWLRGVTRVDSVYAR